MTLHSTDEAASQEGAAQTRAFISSRPRRSGCRVHLRVTSDAKANRRALKKSQLEISFRQQQEGLNDALSPAMLVYLNGVNATDR
jgi:arylamine N-acetyltransferase